MADTINLHVTDSGGTGRPVVLVHGWPLSGDSWRAQVGPLSEAGYRVVTYDRRGFGQSDKPAAGYDYDTLSDDLHGVLETLDLRDAAIVGFSMGGGEVVRYLARHGADRVGAAVLAAAVPPYLYAAEDNPEGPLDDDAIAQFQDGASGPDREQFFTGFVRDFMTAGETTLASEDEQHELVEVALQSDPTAAKECVASFARTDFRADLAAVTVPALVIHGDADAIVPFEVSGKRSAEAIDGAALHVVEGGPHGLNASHAEEFNRVLLEFLGTL